MSTRLKNKTALITGAARGIGESIAEHFARQGARVIINDLNQDAADKVATRLGGLGIATDVADSTSVKKMFEQALEFTGGSLDILVNNAGISGLEGDNEAQSNIAKRAAATAEGEPEVAKDNSIIQTTDEQWERMLGVHMGGTFYCCREAIPIMQQQGSGSIINIASVMGTFGRPGAVAYSAAKGGILGFSRALAHEVAANNVRINCIAPGWIETAMTAPMEPLKPLFIGGIPMATFGETDDIAWAAVYLASDEAKYMTGQVISPNGGWYMSQ